MTDLFVRRDLLSKNRHVKKPFFFIYQHGLVYSMFDYLGIFYPERSAFWQAIEASKDATDTTMTLHMRCRAVRNARSHWCLFLKLIQPYEPDVPSLPE